jgi:hypothetical protein
MYWSEEHEEHPRAMKMRYWSNSIDQGVADFREPSEGKREDDHSTSRSLVVAV